MELRTGTEAELPIGMRGGGTTDMAMLGVLTVENFMEEADCDS